MAEKKEPGKRKRNKKQITSKNELIKKDTSKKENALLKQIGKDTSSKSLENKRTKSIEESAKKNPLFTYLNPPIYQNKEGKYEQGQTAMVGRSLIKDTARVNYMIKLVKNVFPRNVKFAWIVKPSGRIERCIRAGSTESDEP